MRTRYPWVVLALFAAMPVASSQEKTEKDGHAIEVRFADDSVVKMTLKDAAIDVVTRYGKLSVPAGELRRIDFGLHVSADVARRIEAAMARLNVKEAGQREAAAAELLALRELAYPAVRRAADGKDTEASRRAADLLRQFNETIPADRLQVPPHDTVVAIDFTIIGRVEAASLQAKSPYFGETTLKLAELRSLRRIGEDRATAVSIDAARHGSRGQDAWLDTGIDVRAGLALRVVATGSIELQSPDGTSTQVGPDGRDGRRMDRGERGGFPAAGGGLPAAGRGGFPDGRGRNPLVAGSAAAGVLVGRIGENGRVFVIGSRYEADAAESGRLFLRILTSPDGSTAAGSYSARIATGR